MRLDLVVGPNGAGKSTFVQLSLAPHWSAATFVNADEIAAQRWPDDPARHAYDAADIAAATRRRIVELGRPLIAETVFSHPSKLELIATAHAAGYYVALHVLMVPVELSVARVAARVRAGGHAVPEHKVRARHARLWQLVRAAIDTVDSATCYDNSSLNGPTVIALFSDGTPVGEPRWSDWSPPELRERWPPEQRTR